MSHNSRELLQETVSKLISHNQQFTTIFDEISSLKGFKSTDKFQSCLTKLGCTGVLQNEYQQANIPIGQYGTDLCTTTLLTLLKDCKGPLLSTTQKDEFQAIVAKIQHLKLQSSFDEVHFCHQLCEPVTIPMEVLLKLHKEGILLLDKYITVQQRRGDMCSVMTDSLSQLSTDPAGEQCIADIFTVIVMLAFGDPKTNGTTVVKDICCSIVDKFTLGMVDTIMEKTKIWPQSDIHNCPSCVYGHLDVDPEVMKNIYTHILTLVITHKPLLKVSQVIRKQSEWAYSKIHPDLVYFYKQILLPFESTELLVILRNILEQREVNWQLLLSFVSVVTVCIAESSKALLDLTDNLLHSGLENCDIEQTIMGMVLSRQACFQGPHVFMTYSDWFQRTFCDSSRALTNSRKTCIFFLKFLTDLMPYESAIHLKVHISHPVAVPAKCRPILTDYIALARTRLTDLKDTVDIAGHEATGVVPVSKSRSQADIDVSNAVSSYEATGKISSSIMEASIFRKPYYVGQFLPALLIPRTLPDHPDTRMKFIAALKKADKIPLSMYTNYVKACNIEAMQLMEGVFPVDDSDDEMELSPLEQLENSLKQLTMAVTCINKETGNSKMSVLECVSVICETIECVLSLGVSDRLGHDGQTIQPVQIRVNHLNVTAIQLKIVDAMLNCISQCLQISYTSDRPDFTWLPTLLKAILAYSTVVRSVYTRIWALITTMGEKLENHHVDSLAAVLTEIQLLGSRLPCVQLLGNYNNKCRSPNITMPETIAKCLSVVSHAHQLYTLRFTSAYLKYIYTARSGEDVNAIVPTLVKKFVYLSTRLIPGVRFMNNKEKVRHVEEDLVTSIYQMYLDKLEHIYQFTLGDFVEYEVTVCPEADTLTDFQRYEYYQWMVYVKCLGKSVQDGGLSGDYRLAARAVLRGLLNTGYSGGVAPHYRCEGCIKSADIPYNTMSAYKPSNSRTYLLALLQELTSLFEIKDHHDNSVLPWLPGQLTELLSADDNYCGQTAIVQQYFRLALSLPAYLMFGDCPRSLELSGQRLEAVVVFINTVLVEHLTEGLYFPVSITAYLVQGLYTGCRTSDVFFETLDDMCHRCPALCVSIMVHSSSIAQLQSITQEKHSAVADLLCCNRSTIIEHGTDPLLCAASIVGKVVGSQHRSDLVSEIIQILHVKHKHIGEIRQLLIQMFILQLSYIQNYMNPQDTFLQEKIEAVLTGIFRPDSILDSVTHLFKHSETDSISTSKHVQDKRNLTILGFFAKHKDTEDLTEQLTTTGILTQLLHMYIAVGRLYDADPTYHHSDQSTSLEEMVCHTRFIQQVIQHTPVAVLRSLKQELLIDCGPGISEAVVQALQHK